MYAKDAYWDQGFGIGENSVLRVLVEEGAVSL